MKKEEGQSLVEFALVFPLLITLLLIVHDVSQFVSVKSNLQNLTGEISKMSSLYNERNDEGGIQNSHYFNNFDEAVNYVIAKDNTLNHDNLEYDVSIGPEEIREFDRHYGMYDPYYGRPRYVAGRNANYVKHVTVTLRYKPDKGNFLSAHFLGEDFRIKRSYTGLIYVGSDGHE